MKKILPILLLVVSSISHGQEFSIIDQGNKWAYRSFDPQCDPNDPYNDGCLETVIEGFRINGETTINNTTYAIVERGSNVTQTWVFSSYLREEEGIVYTYSESQGETILYNFNLEVGDMVAIDFAGDCPMDNNDNGFADVIDVSTQFIAGENRKVITFDISSTSNFSDHEQWIEGIGSTIDLYDHFAVYCDYAIALNCYNNGNEIFDFSGFDEDCNSLLNILEVSKTTASLIPNPISEQSTITISNLQNNTTIVFYNILGQQISQKELISNTTIINRSEFPSNGMYFYQIQQQGQIIETQKFIVK